MYIYTYVYICIIIGKWNNIHDSLINKGKVIKHHAVYKHNLCWACAHKIERIFTTILTTVMGFQVAFILFSGF